MNIDKLKQQIYGIAKSRDISLDIDNPKTIQDKINFLKIYDLNKLKTKCADKIEVHGYVTKKLGTDICVPILKIYEFPNKMKFNELPDRFVLKCNHGWNMNIVCKDKSALNETDCRNKLEKWLSIDFGKQSSELHYSDIVPRCFAELFLSDNGNCLTDYKFWCFNGVPKFFNIFCEHGNNYYDFDFNLLKINNIYAPADYNKKYKKPSCFDKMLKYARLLCKDFKFVRIDFYEVNNVVYLGEMTFTPGNGFMKYTDENVSLMLGNMLEL